MYVKIPMVLNIAQLTLLSLKKTFKHCLDLIINKQVTKLKDTISIVNDKVNSNMLQSNVIT